MAGEGRDSRTLRDFADHLRRRGLAQGQIRTICSDMSPAYIKGISEEFGGALLVFDYFHVVQLVSNALDQVRRRERREFPQELKGVRWAMLKGEDRLTDAERETRSGVCAGKLQTGKVSTIWTPFGKSCRKPTREPRSGTSAGGAVGWGVRGSRK